MHCKAHKDSRHCAAAREPPTPMERSRKMAVLEGRHARFARCGQFSQSQFAKFRMEGLRSHVQIHSKSIASQHLSEEFYACKNSKPQGLEEILRHECLKPTIVSWGDVRPISVQRSPAAFSRILPSRTGLAASLLLLDPEE